MGICELALEAERELDKTAQTVKRKAVALDRYRELFIGQKIKDIDLVPDDDEGLIFAFDNGSSIAFRFIEGGGNIFAIPSPRPLNRLKGLILRENLSIEEKETLKEMGFSNAFAIIEKK